MDAVHFRTRGEDYILRNELALGNRDALIVFLFCEQHAPGEFALWANPFTCLRVPKIYNLRMDPYEHADISGSGYDKWGVDNAYLTADAVMRAAAFLQTFVEYPPVKNRRASRLIKSCAGGKQKDRGDAAWQSVIISPKSTAKTGYVLPCATDGK